MTRGHTEFPWDSTALVQVLLLDLRLRGKYDLLELGFSTLKTTWHELLEKLAS